MIERELLAECKRFLEDMHAMPPEWTVKESQRLHTKVTDLLDESAPLTKNGVAVRVGQVWEDCDKRMDGRRCRVIVIDGDKVLMERIHDTIKSRSKVSVSRMHPGTTGWKLIA